MEKDQSLINRVRELIAPVKKKVEEKKMFGGLCFMVDEKMCVGAHEDHIMVRIGPENFDAVIDEAGFEPMVHRGKTLKGYGFVDISVLKTKKQLERWIGMALAYNKHAKSSRKK